MLTEEEQLTALFPDRSKVVFFTACEVSSCIKDWENTIGRISMAVDHATQNGGRHFICDVYNNDKRVLRAFLQEVDRYRQKYPDITLNLCNVEREVLRLMRIIRL